MYVQSINQYVFCSANKGSLIEPLQYSGYRPNHSLSCMEGGGGGGGGRDSIVPGVISLPKLSSSQNSSESSSMGNG